MLVPGRVSSLDTWNQQGERCNWSLLRPSLGQDSAEKMPSSSWTSLQSEALPKHHWGFHGTKTD